MISPVQQEVVLSHKLLEHVYGQESPFRLKEDNLLQKKKLQSLESSKFLSHRSRISGELDSMKDLRSAKFERKPQMLVRIVL